MLPLAFRNALKKGPSKENGRQEQGTKNFRQPDRPPPEEVHGLGNCHIIPNQKSQDSNDADDAGERDRPNARPDHRRGVPAERLRWSRGRRQIERRDIDKDQSSLSFA